MIHTAETHPYIFLAVPSLSGDLAQEGIPVLPESTVGLPRGHEPNDKLDLDSYQSGRQALPEVDMSSGIPG